MRRCRMDTPFGLWTAEFDGAYLRALQPRPPAGPCDPEPPAADRLRAWLSVYFTGRDPGPPPLLAPAGTPFQTAVWALLREIPFGRTTTYGALAHRLAADSGRPAAAQAVGQAVGRNPVTVLIPCHRVLGSGGTLTGYAGGLPLKAALLRLEGHSLQSSAVSSSTCIWERAEGMSAPGG